MRFGTDRIRGVANTELTPSFALDLGRAAARVLGATCAVVFDSAAAVVHDPRGALHTPAP